jgi:hypothetical protein
MHVSQRLTPYDHIGELSQCNVMGCTDRRDLSVDDEIVLVYSSPLIDLRVY